ncbi:MAG: gluconate 2-dehydrogenase subunit 3 family protein [Nitrososphaerales archaeon]|jgi:gluconate 2-dehydrogenase gamma chain
MVESTKPAKEGDRRTFLKVGAGLVVGAAVAGVATDAYLSSVISGNNSSSSSTVSSLQSQLDVTSSQLNSAQGQVSSLNSQLSSTQAQLSSANSQLSSVSTELSSTQQALASANGQVSSLSGQVSTLNTQVTSLNSAVTTASSQAAALQSSLDSDAAFLVLNSNEQIELEAIVETIIPSDSSGAGAKEAGVVYFIDHQLKGIYGNDGNVYIGGPWIPANTQTAVTQNGVTYSGATVTYSVASTNYTVKYPPTANVRVGAGTRYQYAWNKREFWRLSLAGIETYANAAYGGNFEALSATNQAACLTDLWNNKPTAAQFGGILPSDFAYELFFMTWAGFGMDPVYGGNKGMAGWLYTGFNGVNMGNFYNEGYSTKAIMVATTPITLKPASLGQFQKGSP